MKRTEQTIKPPRGVNKDKTYISQYKGVSRYIHPTHGFVWYSARVGKMYVSYHFNEIDAAKAVDRHLISNGKDPVNVFRPKTTDLSDSEPNMV